MATGLNPTLIHDDIEAIRVVVGPSGSTSHPILGTVPNKGVLPIRVYKSGTLSTFNTDASLGKEVLGDANTKFQDEFNPNDYITDGLCLYARRILFVKSQNRMTLEAAFPSSQSGISVYKIPKPYRRIKAQSLGSAAAVLQEQTFPTNAEFQNGGAPVSYDASASNTQVLFTLNK